MWSVVHGDLAGHRRAGALQRLLPLAAAASIAVAGCGTSPVPTGSATSSGSNPPADASPGGSSGSGPQDTLPPDPLGLIPANALTGAPDPIALQVTTAKAAGVAKLIGPDGGSVEAKGADGTVYTLAIPPNALPLPMTIGVTPVAAVSGYPTEMAPTHHLGVVFAPDGLPLAATATLTVHPAGPIDGAAAVVDFEGDGANAGLHVFDRGATDITIPIDHFSGYIVEFPVTVGAIKSFAQRLQDFTEKRFATEIAGLVGIERQRSLFGEGDADALLQLAEAWVNAFKKTILLPRIADAPKGCAESEVALAAIVSYERQRQIIGLDDPRFAATPVDTIVPQGLLDLAVTLCFEQAFRRCSATGDFPGMAVYMYGMFARNENMLSAVPTEKQLDLAHSFLRRCGRWRLTLDLSAVTPDRILGYTQTEETKREIDLQWKAGPGLYGIVGSTIKGEGEIDVMKLEHVDEICGRGKITAVLTQKPATAEIVDLVFERYEAIDAIASKLTMKADLGLLGYDLKSCPLLSEPPHHNTDPFGYASELVTGSADPMLLYSGGTVTLDLADGWTFSKGPFKATRPWSGSFKSIFGGDKTTAKLDATLEHTPG